jgi:hypothetical protein
MSRASDKELEELSSVVPMVRPMNAITTVNVQPRRGSIEPSRSVSSMRRIRSPSDVYQSVVEFQNISKDQARKDLETMKKRSLFKYSDAQIKSELVKPGFVFRGADENRAVEPSYPANFTDKMLYHVDRYGTGKFIDIIGGGPNSQAFKKLQQIKQAIPEELPTRLIEDLDEIEEMSVKPTETDFYADGGIVEPARDWLRKHNELNERLRQIKAERFADGGLIGYFKGLAEASPLIDFAKQNLGQLDSSSRLRDTSKGRKTLDSDALRASLASQFGK